MILEPLRDGIAHKTLKKVMDLKAIGCYLSCNPYTQARDIDLLSQSGYELKKFSLVDQFPHTSHVESVVLLELK